MSRYLFLDTGSLGMVTNPKASGVTLECQLWLNDQLLKRAVILVPEIADYEVRRELLRAGKIQGIRQLDQFETVFEYISISTEMMLKAAELWAKARQLGQATAQSEALDGDVILAAQALIIAQQRQWNVTIATTNVGHLSRFTTAQNWQDIL
jgi:predicted nucleic acid-binding protein